MEQPDERTDKELAQTAYELGGGFLSKGQYEYLIAGGDDLSDSAERHRRKKIRQNFQDTIFDLHTLMDMADKDVAKAIEPTLNLVDMQVTTDQQSKLGEGIRSDSVADVGDSEIEKDDLKKGYLMLQGIRRFFSMISDHYGDEMLLSMTEIALRNQNINSDSGIPEVSVEATIGDEKITSVDSGEADVDLLSKMESLD